MTHARAHNQSPRRAARAFTVIELVVVLGVVAVLIGLIIGVGPRVVDNQRAQATRTLIGALDRMLDEYMQDNAGRPPRYDSVQYELVPGRFLADSPNSDENLREQYPSGSSRFHIRHPDAAIFLRQAQASLGAGAITRDLPERYLVRTNTFSTDAGTGSQEEGLGALTVLDAWGAVDPGWQESGLGLPSDPPPRSAWPVYGATFIHYVHPENELAQELYGRCLNNRPYFFSAGPDRRFGVTHQLNRANPGVRNASLRDDALKALDDNIYSYEPGPVNRSEGFGNNFR
ncbi:MAG: hypothetical protein EA379_06580 [Phycisphaerales bacterium]|nr:MAG: hypothetical protein EA379_06580 [Phycisphaerales bacterium]